MIRAKRKSFLKEAFLKPLLPSHSQFPLLSGGDWEFLHSSLVTEPDPLLLRRKNGPKHRHPQLISDSFAELQ